MKSLLIGKSVALGIGVGMFALSASAAGRVWKGAFATSPADAADFAGQANWNPEAVPGTADSLSLPWQASVWYVKSATAQDVAALYGTKGSAAGIPGYVSDKKLSMALPADQTDPMPGFMYYYAPVEITTAGNHYFRTAYFAGDLQLASGGILYPHGGEVVFCYDRYAADASEWRLPPKIQQISAYSGSLYFNGPASRAADFSMPFDVTDGSVFIYNKGGYSAKTLVPGALVTGAGIPDGTFVQAIYDSFWVRLSKPANQTLSGTTLTFAAKVSKLRQAIGTIGHNSAHETFPIYVNGSATTAAGAEFELDFGTLTLDSDYNGWTFIGTQSASYIPGRVVIHDNNDVDGGYLRLGSCDILFADRPNGKTPGLPKSRVLVDNATYAAKVSVTGQMTAVIGKLQSVIGSFTKCGTGTLVATVYGSSNTGTIAVDGGTFACAEDAGGTVVGIGTLRIGANGTFKVPSQGVRCSAFSFAPGATVEGPGTLELPAMADISGLRLTQGATVSVAGKGGVIREGDEAMVPGNPAFWVDCSKSGTMTLNTGYSYGGRSFTGVSRINDVRSKAGVADSYLFATNASNGTYLPELVTESAKGMSGVYFAGNRVSGSSNPAESDTLVWSRPVQNIRAVFQVLSLNEANGGGQYLGNLNVKDWSRYIYPSTGELFTWAMSSGDAVRKGSLWFDDAPADQTKGYPYVSYDSLGSHWIIPAVSAHVPKSDEPLLPRADSFDYAIATFAAQNDIGNKYLFELIVYTNEVTEAERKTVMAYLMKKWKDTNVVFAPCGADGKSFGEIDTSGGAGGISVPAGADRIVDKVGGSGTFVKSGEGTLVVKKVEGSGTSLTVKGGTVEVKSVSADETIVPDGAFAHFDASKLDTLDCTVADNVTNVNVWTDVRGGSTQRAAFNAVRGQRGRPTLRRSAALKAGPYVDFGEAQRQERFDVGPLTSLAFDTESDKLRTVIAVWGSEKGGGNLVAHYDSNHHWHTRYALVRAGETSSVIGGTASAAVLRTDMQQPRAVRTARGTRFRKNGVACDPTATGLSGAWDIVSLVSMEHFGAGSLSGTYIDCGFCGGEQFAEYLLYPQGLSEQEVQDVEAYLRKKWFGTSTPGYEPTAFETVSVEADATLKVTGNGPVVAKRIVAASGRIDGALALAAEDAGIEAVVASDGSVSGGLSATGGIVLPATGTLRFTGAVDRLAAGSYTLATGVTVDGAFDWAIDRTGVRDSRLTSLAVMDGDLVLTVAKTGLVLIVR